jgi:hypothetical protein
MSIEDRRRFLKVAGTLAATGLVCGLPDPVCEGAGQEILVTGKSVKGSLQEALDDAIAEAFNQGPKYPDVMFTYEIRTINGRRGGFAGFNELFVTIRAHFG